MKEHSRIEYERIREKAFKGPISQTGTQSLSRAGLDSALKEIGPRKFQILFSQKERDFIRDLKALSVLKEPPAATILGKGPSAQAVSGAVGELTRKLDAIPGIGPFASAVIDGAKNKATEKRVLKMISQAEEIAKENEKRFLANLRKSKTGQAVKALPALAIPAVAQGETEQQ